MTRGELIAALEAAPQDRVCREGFGQPHSDRGNYSDLAFAPAKDVSVASMLANAKSALGATFDGYKGGKYTMSEWTSVFVGEWGACGEPLSPWAVRWLLSTENTTGGHDDAA